MILTFPNSFKKNLQLLQVIYTYFWNSRVQIQTELSISCSPMGYQIFLNSYLIVETFIFLTSHQHCQLTNLGLLNYSQIIWFFTCSKKKDFLHFGISTWANSSTKWSTENLGWIVALNSWSVTQQTCLRTLLIVRAHLKKSQSQSTKHAKLAISHIAITFTFYRGSNGLMVRYCEYMGSAHGRAIILPTHKN